MPFGSESLNVNNLCRIWPTAEAVASQFRFAKGIFQKFHRQVAEQGGWVEFDGIAPDTIDRHVELVQAMKQNNLSRRVLLSHDAGWYSVGEPKGGKFRPYITLFKKFPPALKKAGFSDEEIRLLTIQNPAEAFTIRVRAKR